MSVQVCALTDCSEPRVVDVITTGNLRYVGRKAWRIHLCEQHAELLEGFFAELHFPDGRVIRHAENELNLGRDQRPS